MSNTLITCNEIKSYYVYLYFSEELYVYPYAFSSVCLRRNKLLDHTPTVRTG